MSTAYNSNDITLNNITDTETFNLSKFTENFQTIKEHIDGTKTKIGEIDTSLSGKAQATHGHSISDITDLQTTLTNTNNSINSLWSTVSDKADSSYIDNSLQDYNNSFREPRLIRIRDCKQLAPASDFAVELIPDDYSTDNFINADHGDSSKLPMVFTLVLDPMHNNTSYFDSTLFNYTRNHRLYLPGLVYDQYWSYIYDVEIIPTADFMMGRPQEYYIPGIESSDALNFNFTSNDITKNIPYNYYCLGGSYDSSYHQNSEIVRYGTIPSWLDSKFPDTPWTRRPCRAYPMSIPKPTHHAKILLQSCPSQNSSTWSGSSYKNISYDTYGTNIQNIVIQGYNNSSSATGTLYPEWIGSWTERPIQSNSSNGVFYRIDYSWYNNYAGRERSLFLEFDYGDVVTRNYL